MNRQARDFVRNVRGVPFVEGDVVSLHPMINKRGYPRTVDLINLGDIEAIIGKKGMVTSEPDVIGRVYVYFDAVTHPNIPSYLLQMEDK